MKIKRHLLTACFIVTVIALQAQLRLPSILADHMVLQQQTEVALWGWGNPGSEVVIKPGWSNEETKVKVLNTGAWKTSVKTPPAGGPHTISFKSGHEIILNDVMVGEVWICSGQSNMEWNMNGTVDGKEEVPDANFPGIRLFHAKKIASAHPQVHMDGEWKVTTPEEAQWFSAVAYFFGKKLHQQLNVPIGLIHASWGGTPAEVWTPDSLVTANPALRASATKQRIDARWPYQPGVVYNAMIYPILSYGIAGAIWYQGEGNTAAPLTYKELMEQMILGWRKGFQRDFPFYYVQIAPFSGYGNIETGTLIREQQVKMLEIPKTGMVVISDLVDDVKDIHPRYKKLVGERLADNALGDAYGKTNIVYRSPLYKSMKVEKSRIRITFDNVPNGLMSKGGEPAEFLIAGPDKKFVPAKAKIEGNTIVVSAKEIKNPVAVRFGWPNGSIPNVFSKEGLPLSCFRTDDWAIPE